MPKRKTLASLEKQIALTQNQMLKAKARYEKLGEKLLVRIWTIGRAGF